MAEIDFQVATGNHEWLAHESAAGLVAQRRLQLRYDGVVQGIQWFRDDADTMIKEVIKKPPGKVSFLGALVESMLPALEVLVPEAGLAMEIVEATKTVYETVKPAAELMDKVNEEVVANSVEAAQSHMQEIVKHFAEDVIDKAGPVTQAAGAAVPDALRHYVDANPQEFRDDPTFHNSLVDAIGIHEPELSAVKMQAYEKVFPPFKAELLKTSAQLHFFHDLDGDGERLKFLLEEVVMKGTDPDQFLTLIGAKKEVFDPFVEIYHQNGGGPSGEDAALAAYFSQHFS